MDVDFSTDIPIYRQLATQIEEAILTGAFPEETQIPSTNEIAQQFKINPATILKGMNLLVNENILYKKRGVGMFVTKGAIKQIKNSRKKTFYSHYIVEVVQEAKRLGISKEELLEQIEGGFQDEND